MEMIYPTVEDIIKINKKAGLSGALINRNNLEFTLDHAKSAKTMEAKAANLLQGIIQGHPFVDGNKRTAFVTMEFFLELNGKELEYSKADELLMERVLYDIAENRVSKESIISILKELIK